MGDPGDLEETGDIGGGGSAGAMAEKRGQPVLGGHSVQETEPGGFTLRGTGRTHTVASEPLAPGDAASDPLG